MQRFLRAVIAALVVLNAQSIYAAAIQCTWAQRNPQNANQLRWGGTLTLANNERNGNAFCRYRTSGPPKGNFTAWGQATWGFNQQNQRDEWETQFINVGGPPVDVQGAYEYMQGGVLKSVQSGIFENQ